MAERATLQQRGLTPLVSAALATHLAAPGLFFAWPHTWPWLLGAIAGANASCAVAGLVPSSRLLGPNRSRCDPGHIALTFDDGPDPVATPRILEQLKAHGVRATFFFIGRRAALYPELVREVVDQGHWLGNHTYTHPLHFAFFGPRAMRREIEQTQEILTEISGFEPVFFRPPAGVRSPLLQPVLASTGLELASWSKRGFDAVSDDSRAILQRIVRGLHGGDIVLLHDGRAQPWAGDERPVLRVLPPLLEHLRRAGLRTGPILDSPNDAQRAPSPQRAIPGRPEQ